MLDVSKHCPGYNGFLLYDMEKTKCQNGISIVSEKTNSGEGK